MKLRNLYHNPNHVLSTGREDCPIFVRKNMELSFCNDILNVKTIANGPSYIAFGGCGGKKIRLGLECGETYTVALKVHLNKVLEGNISKNALKISFGYIDENDTKFEMFSNPAPNMIGIWDISYTYTVPLNVKGAWCTFVVGTQNPKDLVAISDIRITQTKSKCAPFFMESKGIKFPYRDIMNEDFSIREYNSPVQLNFQEYIEYLIFAREYGYSYDIEMIYDSVSNDDIYCYLTNLFVYDNVGEESEIESVKKSCDREVLVKIAEKMVQLRRFDRAKVIMSGLIESQEDMVSKLIKCDLCANEENVDESRRYFKSIETKSFSIDKYKVSKEQLLDIINKFSIVRSVCRLNTLRWVLKNLPELQRRATLMCNSEYVDVSKRPVWVYWAQGIENAPEIVKKCVNNLKEVYGNRLHVLSNDNIKYYIATYNAENIGIIPNYSDYVRCELLYRYGGTWIDSTCFIKETFKDITDTNDCVMANYASQQKVAIGSWLLSSSEQKNYFWALLYATLMLWISECGDFNEYYMFHILVRILVMFDPKAKEYWENAFLIDASKAIVFSQPRQLIEKLSVEDYEMKYNDSPILKLTYKYDYNLVGIESNVSRLFREK